MMNLHINLSKNTIEMSKKFAAKASQFGTEEYRMLQEVRRDYPQFKVVTVSQKSGKSDFKGLTFEYMEMYIEKHDDADGSIMTEFKLLRGQDDDSIGLEAESEHYTIIKSWFLDQFPAIKAHHERREQMAAGIRQKSAEAAKAKREATRKAAYEAKRAALRVRFA